MARAEVLCPARVFVSDKTPRKNTLSAFEKLPFAEVGEILGFKPIAQRFRVFRKPRLKPRLYAAKHFGEMELFVGASAFGRAALDEVCEDLRSSFCFEFPDGERHFMTALVISFRRRRLRLCIASAPVIDIGRAA